jgi:hypothetical protein
MSKYWTTRLAKWLPWISLVGILAIGWLAASRQGAFDVHLRRAVAWELSRVVGHRAQVGRAELSLLRANAPTGQRFQPLRFHVVLHDVSIKQPAPWPGNLVTVPQASVDVDALRLLSIRPFMSTLVGVEAKQPQVNLIRGPNGHWNLQELRIRKAPRPVRFPGRIVVSDARILFVDYAPPDRLAVPQRNRLLHVTCFATTPQLGRVQFRLWGRNPSGRPGRLFAAGSFFTTPGAAPGFNAAVNLAGADVGYFWRYRPFARNIAIPKGNADLTGYFVLNSRSVRPTPYPRTGRSQFDYALAATSRATTIDLPWVRATAQDTDGRIRISNGLLQLSDIRGKVGASLIQGDGYVQTSAVRSANLARPAGGSAPVAQHGYSLHLQATGVGAQEAMHLVPVSATAALAGWQGRGQAQVNITGYTDAPVVYGSVTVPSWQVQGALPLDNGAANIGHKLSLQARTVQAGFVYADHAFGTNIAASIMNGSGHGAIFLPAVGNPIFNISFANAEIQPVAIPSAGATIDGRVWGNFAGTLSSASTKRGRGTTVASLNGDFALLNGQLTTPGVGIRPARFPFQNISGSVAYANGNITLPLLHAQTSYGQFNLAGNVNRTGAIAASFHGNSIGLARIGPALGMPASGTGFVSANISGTLKVPTIIARADVFAGDYQGYTFDWLGAEAQLQGRTLPSFSVVLHRGSGEALVNGNAVLPFGTAAGRLSAQGRIVKAQLAEWLPAGIRTQAGGVVDANFAVVGSVRAPQVSASFDINRPAFAGMQFDTAQGRVSYANGAFSLPNFILRADHSQLTASGQTTPNGNLNFIFTADRLQLQPFLSTLSSVPGISGQLSLSGSVTGRMDAPHAVVNLNAEDVRLDGQPASGAGLSGKFSWMPTAFNIDNLDLAIQGGHLPVSGKITAPPGQPTAPMRDWIANLDVGAQGLPIGPVLSVLETDLRTLPPARSARLLHALAKIPRPIRGFLTGNGAITGPLVNPAGSFKFGVTDGALADQPLPALDGEIAFTGSRIDIKSLAARTGEATASAVGVVDLAHDVDVNIDIHNLGAETLRPWISQIPNLGGAADIYLRITGPVSSPAIRGDLEIADPIIANTKFERLKIDSFTLAGGRLDIIDLRLVNQAHRARISASLPYSLGAITLDRNGPVRAEINLDNQDLSFISDLWSDAGKLSGPVDAHLVIAGTAAQPLLESGLIHAQGTWQMPEFTTQIALDAPVHDHVLWLQDPNGGPGLVARFGKSANRESASTAEGTLTATGEYDPFAGPTSRWGLGRYNFIVKADNARAAIGRVFSGRADADLILHGDAAATPADTISGSVNVLSAKITPPQRGLGAFSWRPQPFSPAVNVAVTIKNVTFASPSLNLTLAGQGTLGGHLGYEPLALNLRLTSHQGRLALPAANADVKSVTVTVVKAAEGPLQASASVSAQAHVGRYRVDLSGNGQVFPTSTLNIRAESTPPLTQIQVTALLLGFQPSFTEFGTTQSESILGQQISRSLYTSPLPLASLGISSALSRLIGLSELSFAYSPLATQVAIGKRISNKIYIYYLSAVTGAVQSNLTRLTYDLTPHVAVGFSVNELQQWRYEIQTYRTF